jgi:hypothetical protein
MLISQTEPEGNHFQEDYRFKEGYGCFKLEHGHVKKQKENEKYTVNRLSNIAELLAYSK